MGASDGLVLNEGNSLGALDGWLLLLEGLSLGDKDGALVT